MVRKMTSASASALISRREIQAFVDDVVVKFHPLRVILFGSYAYGEPNADSDVDLLVIMQHRMPGPRVAGQILLKCRSSFAVDLLVRSPSAIRKRLLIGDPFIGEIVSKGQALYEADNARVG